MIEFALQHGHFAEGFILGVGAGVTVVLMLVNGGGK